VAGGEQLLGQVLEVAKLEDRDLLALEDRQDARLHASFIRPKRGRLVAVAGRVRMVPAFAPSSQAVHA
jgi:hypothetical protein